MYICREERKKELKDGRTCIAISEMFEMSRVTIIRIINGTNPCRKTIALALISLKEHIPVGDERMPELLEYYFKKV